MDTWSLVSEEIDAGAELAREFDKFKPVSAAFWLKASDDDQRYLYVASEEIDDTNFDLAYGEVLRLAAKMHSIYLDPFRVSWFTVNWNRAGWSDGTRAACRWEFIPRKSLPSRIRARGRRAVGRAACGR